MSATPTNPPTDPPAPATRDPDGQRAGLLADLRAAASSDEVALKVLVASVVVLAVGSLGVKAAVGGVIASQVLSEAVKSWVERRRMSTRRKWLVSLLLLLFERAKDALAAVRRAFRVGPGVARPSAALTSVLAAVLTVMLFTAPELVLGDSLTDDRKTTFFGGSRGAPGPSPPILSMPRALVREATSPRGATIDYTVAARDPSARTILVTCSPRSGSRFPLGTSTVSCSAAAPAGPDADGAFRVTVADRTPPRFELPRPIRVATRSRTGASVTYAATASDAVSGAVTPRCRPLSRTRFDVGTTKVACTARDTARNTARGSFLVTVARDGGAGTGGGPGDRDRTPPTLDLPAGLRVEASSARGALVRYGAKATDAVDGRLKPTCSPASRTVFAIRTHTVSCSAADAAGNVVEDDFRVTVFDAPPVVSVPGDIRRPYSRPLATTIRYAASARDRIDGELPARCSPRSGTHFKVTTTVVRCTATDSAGNDASAKFTVTVVDLVPPKLKVENITTYSDDPVEVDYDKHVSAFDAVDDSVQIECDPPSGSTFDADKTTQVSCTAIDDSGNKDSDSFRVSVNTVVE
jgi:hypothetical protein